MSKKGYKVPPDGGYGWVVTFAYALNNVVVLPLITGFGLLMQESINETGLSSSQVSLVIILNHSIGMLLSFFGGPLLRRFGYRKVAVAGALLIAVGLIMTSFASGFWSFVLSYSIINSMGVAAVMAAFTLAINSFFKEKRARAIGVGMSITGLGGICMPILISTLIYAYGWRSAIRVLSALCLHSLMAACLLRPAKWYLIDPPNSEEMVPLNKDTNVEHINGSITSSTKPGIPSLIHSSESGANGILPPKSLSMRSLTSDSSVQTRNAVSHPDIRKKSSEQPLSESRYRWWESQEINLGSSINIFNEIDNSKRSKETEVLNDKKEKKGYIYSFIEFFDLTLLSDPIFVNILFGLSIAASVETNFSLLLPLILRDMSFETSQQANIMSILNFSDTLFRCVAPFIGEWCHKSPRVMYMVSLLLIIFIRTRPIAPSLNALLLQYYFAVYRHGAINFVSPCLFLSQIMLFTTSFSGMVFVAVAMGITKGIRTVYMNVVIPSYVPIGRLAFASGIQMFFNGFTIFSIGFLISRIRESSGSYQVPIIVLNMVTLITVALWCVEFLYSRIKNKDKPEEQTVV